MPKYTKEKQQEHKEIIRTLIVKNPALTIYEAQRQLLNDKEKLKLDKNYINKIMKEIQAERSPAQLSRTEKAFSDFQNESIVAKKFLWDIVDNNNETNFLRMTALKEIRNWSTSMLDRVINAKLPDKIMLTQQNYQTNIIDAPDLTNLSQEELEAKVSETITNMQRRMERIKSIRASLKDNSPETEETTKEIEMRLEKMKDAKLFKDSC